MRKRQGATKKKKETERSPEPAGQQTKRRSFSGNISGLEVQRNNHEKWGKLGGGQGRFTTKIGIWEPILMKLEEK